MRDTRNLISPEDLLEIFSEVALKYKKKARKKTKGKESNKITKDELLEIFKSVVK